MDRYLHIGGVVAVGFNSSRDYLLVITHSGRGVFSTKTWERLARCYELAYPEIGFGVGIGPIEGEFIPISMMNFESGEVKVVDPNGRFVLACEGSGIAVIATAM